MVRPRKPYSSSSQAGLPGANALISVPYPKVPDATNTGFLKTVWPIFIVRLVKIYFPGLKYGTIRAHQGVFHMIGMLGLLIISPFDGTTLT